MEDNNVKNIVNECMQIFKEACSYEEAVQKVSRNYSITYDEIYLDESVRNQEDVSKLNVDSMCEKLAFANNQAGMVAFFDGLNRSIELINSKLLASSIASSTGKVSQNPHLHGFVFEEIHVAVFNMRARLAGKPYVARVLKPLPGETFGKNSVDVVIRNTKLGKDVQKYQLKCCENAEYTIQNISNGNYNNQRLLVADGQVESVRKAFPNKTVTSCLEYDGIKSNPIGHNKAKKIQNSLQSGNWESIDWNEYATKDLYYAGIESLKTPVLIDVIIHTVVGVGLKVTGNTNDSWVDVSKKIGISVLDDTSKLALSAAAQILIKKELATTVVGNLGAPEVYAMVSLAVDSVKEVVKVVEGKQTMDQAVENVAKKTVITAAQVAGATGGAMLGTYLGGPVGTKIGMLVGSAGAGYLAEKVYDVFIQEKIEVKEQVQVTNMDTEQKVRNKVIALN